MSWTRKQKIYRTDKKYLNSLNKRRYDQIGVDGVGAAGNKFSSTLPEVYAGHPLRVERYTQYDQMDMDSEVNTALGIIANYCTQDDPDSDLKFQVNYNENVADSEIEVTEKLLRQWCKMNKFKTRLWRMVRSTLKYGDQFFLRDPETLEWYFIDPAKVEKVLVNEAEGKEIEAYIVRDLDINRTMSTASQPDSYGNDLQGQSTNTLQNQVGYQNRYGNVTHYGHYSDGIENILPIAAEHIVHLSLSEGLDAAWPFGTSILESVFKVFRQKELLEDAILIYRIQRAPERRVFYVDVGQIRPDRANAYLERFKNEIQQRRIPSRSGGTETIGDTSYQPLSQIDDYYFAVGEGGRSSRVEILPGGENLGCYSLDTQIRLLNGTDKTILELQEDIKNGITNWTYSCHPITGEIVPGKITWAGPTRKNARVMKFTLDNGKSFICTPDHKFPIRGVGFVEAKDLVEGQSLTGFYERNEIINKNSLNDYTQVFDHYKNEWVYSHRMVADFFKNTNMYQEYTFNQKYIDCIKDVRHHKDHNRYNNNPENIVWMNFKDHKEYHSYYGFSKKAQLLGTIAARNSIENMKINDPMKYKKMIDKQVEKRKEWYNSLSEKEKEIHWKNQKQSLINYYSNLSDEEKEIKSQTAINNLKTAASSKKKKIDNGEIVVGFQYNEKLFKQCVALFLIHGSKTKNDFCEILSNSNDFMNEFKNIHKGYFYTNNVSPHYLLSLMKAFGFTWKTFRAYYTNFNPQNTNDTELLDGYKDIKNHKIMKIEYLEETMDVGTITVDGNEEYHDYHTFALSVGVFTKNSINDLVWWNNKLIRGLGVPAGYLPYGPEDGGSNYNDGRLGTAYQQEFNFAQYCMRLQNLIVETFDKEFKLYLKQRGYNIDSSSFNIDFITPQHFSEYAKIERDSATIGNFQTMVGMPFISPRFAMEHWLGMSKAEIAENERYVLEENPDEETPDENEDGGLSSVGIRGGDDFGGDMDMGDDLDLDNAEDTDMGDTESPISGDQGGDQDLDLPD